MKLRTLGMSVVAALALVAGSAQAQEAGWDTKYGILFTVPNPLGGGSGTDVVDSYDGFVGFQYNLGAQTGIRLGAHLARESCGRTIAKDASNVETKFVCGGANAGSPIFGPTVPSGLGWNSALTIDLQGEYLMRMTTAAVSPYVGAGAGIAVTRFGLSGKDESDAPGFATIEYKNSAYDWSLGVGAKAGLEWRIHKVIALFAEYQVGIELVNRSSYNEEVTETGFPTYKDNGSQIRFFNIDSGVSHGGKLGLVAFF
jgi:opacity protein-like surface antigen